MTLQQRVDSDLKEAMRAKDATKLNVLRMLKSALKYAAIAKSDAEAELNDAEAFRSFESKRSSARIRSKVLKKAGARNWLTRKKKSWRF
jgi:uncharacterized protein YqeY